jgi:hypothetical protein
MLIGTNLFLNDLTKFSNDLDTVNRVEFLTEIGTAIFTEAFLNTPQRTGHLANEWQVLIGLGEIAEESDGVKTDTIARETAKCSVISDTFQIVNPTSYASYVEFGSPTNFPQLMLTRAVASVENVVFRD